MKAQLFFQNSEYAYLKRFTKYDMVQFAEKFAAHTAATAVSYAHQVQPCIVCCGTGKIFDSNSTAQSTCCPNCNGTGNVWV